MGVINHNVNDFVEGKAEQQKVIDGKVFPKILEYNCSNRSGSASVDVDGIPNGSADVVRRNIGMIEEALKEHGAVLLRGLPIANASDFNDVVHSGLAWPDIPYLGTALRSQVVGRVYTASEAPLHLPIAFHHEMSQARPHAIPSKILFYCDVQPPEGGETPIVMSHKVAKKMEEEFPDWTKKTQKEGLMYIKTLPCQKDCSVVVGQSWHDVFGTTSREEAEKRANIDFNANLLWHEDGKVTMIGGPYEPIRTFGGNDDKKVWFNLLVASVPNVEWKGLSNENAIVGKYIVVHKDGSAIPTHILERCRKIHEEMSVDIPWHQGDIMILDNLKVMHGRRPCYHPRRVFVSITS